MVQQRRSIKGPLVIIGIVLIVIVALFAIPFGFTYFKSKAQCGEGGMLIGSANRGYYCGYHSVCEECENVDQCPDCFQFCESKGKVEREGFCGPTKIDLMKEGPVNCYCCCNEKGS